MNLENSVRNGSVTFQHADQAVDRASAATHQAALRNVKRASVAAGLVFGVLVAGTTAGWLVPAIRVLAVTAMAMTIVIWLRSLVRTFDRVDVASLCLVAAFALSSFTSIVPSLSNEALYAALAFAAIFGMSRRLDSAVSSAAIRTIAIIGFVVAVAFLAIWAAAWAAWIASTGVLPRLGYGLPSGPFGHPHNVALLVALTLPAMAFARTDIPRAIRRPVSIAVVSLVVIVIFLSGGRTVWAAIVFASLVLLIYTNRLTRAMKWARRAWIPLTISTIALGSVLAASGLLVTVLTRLMTGETVGIRLGIWSAQIQGWLDAPALGTGPGTFQFALHAAGYFDRSIYVHHHADSIYVQTLTEFGIIGAIACLPMITALVAAWRRARPPAPVIWAIAFAAFAGLASNPAALGYCAVLVAFWAGQSVRGPQGGRRAPRTTLPLVTLIATIGLIPIATSTWAALEFDAARVAHSAGQSAQALRSLDNSVHLNPTFPLYQRTRGAVLLEGRRISESVDALRQSLNANPWDDTTWRALALALLADHQYQKAIAAASRSVDLGQAIALNEATLAYVADRSGDMELRDEALIRFLALTPWAAADPVWHDAFPTVDARSILSEASRRAEGLPVGVDDRWLPVLSGDLPSEVDGPVSRAERALALLLRCSTESAALVVSDVRASDSGDQMYWLMRMVTMRLQGQSIHEELPAFIMSSGVPENGEPLVAGSLDDEYRYGHRALSPSAGVSLPSQYGGIRAWIADPKRAISRLREAGECPAG